MHDIDPDSPLGLVARGQGDRSAALAALDTLHARTREQVGAYLAEARGRKGLLAKRLIGQPGWPEGSPKGAVVHVPALWGKVALDTLDNVRRFMLAGPSHNVSTHLVIGWPDGALFCCVHPKDRAWHAGRANQTSVGFDLVSPGPLVRATDGSWRRWDGNGDPIVRPDGTPLADDDVLDFGPERAGWPWGYRFWHLPTPEQVLGLALALRLARLLHPTMRPELVVRHADLAPANRVDPGPGVPLEAVRAWAWSDEDLLALAVQLADGDRRGWAAFLLNQWRQPRGVVTTLDLKAPGRPGREVA